MSKSIVEKEINNIAICYLEAIIDTLLEKIQIAHKTNRVKDILIVGGVSANKRFRNKAMKLIEKMNINVVFPTPVIL